MEQIGIKANGLEFQALTAGEGPLVLLLHGFPDTPHTFRDLMPRLAGAGYRAVAPWMRGYAPTGVAPDGNYQVISLAQDVVGIIDALAPGAGDGRARIIGHDWGSPVTYFASLLAPEKIARIAVASIAHPLQFAMAITGNYAQAKRSWYMYYFQLPLAAETVRNNDFELVERLWRDWSPGLEPPPDLLAEVRASLKAPENLEAALGWYRALFNPAHQDPEINALGDELGAKTPACPALALFGDNDGCMGAEVSEGMEAFFPAGLDRHVLPNAGHFLHLEAPDEVARLLLDFLKD